jgi:hypothetical protein
VAGGHGSSASWLDLIEAGYVSEEADVALVANTVFEFELRLIQHACVLCFIVYHGER